jgi:hypothetical protein
MCYARSLFRAFRNQEKPQHQIDSGADL